MLVMTQLRIERGWTIRELADAANVSHGTLQGQSRNMQQHIFPNTAKRVADALGVSMWDLVSTDGSRISLKEVEPIPTTDVDTFTEFYVT